ncbi:MAG: nucleotide exchange factor GrpE [Erysipelotrichales bacterium]|nr:nucleotide exchange factor GrpE [Erysipelotrichales bacterium]
MEETKENVKEEKLSRKEKKENKKIHLLEEELKKSNLELEEWKNKYYMAYANLQNEKKMYEKEHLDMIKYRAAGFVEDLMPALDAFHVALQIKPDDQKMQNFLTGFEYIYKNILSVLENEGVTKLEPGLHAKFDSSYMHALDSEESDEEPNTVIKVLSVGYKLKDRIIRPAMVIVARKREPKVEKEEENNSSSAN